MQRLVEFVLQTRLTVRLVYYPPYHSKYNPVERCWGILENHWNGSILDTVEAVVNFTASMTWKGLHPTVSMITTIYHTSDKLLKQDMDLLETQWVRRPGLEKWFVDIAPPSIIWET